jgi:hypothetical protein
MAALRTLCRPMVARGCDPLRVSAGRGWNLSHRSQLITPRRASPSAYDLRITRIFCHAGERLAATSYLGGWFSSSRFLCRLFRTRCGLLRTARPSAPPSARADSYLLFGAQSPRLCPTTLWRRGLDRAAPSSRSVSPSVALGGETVEDGWRRRRRPSTRRTGPELGFCGSGWRDLNSGPLRPEPGLESALACTRGSCACSQRWAASAEVGFDGPRSQDRLPEFSQAVDEREVDRGSPRTCPIRTSSPALRH